MADREQVASTKDIQSSIPQSVFHRPGGCLKAAGRHASAQRDCSSQRSWRHRQDPDGGRIRHRFADRYATRLWVKAHSRELLISDFAAIANLLNLREKDAEDQNLA